MKLKLLCLPIPLLCSCAFGQLAPVGPASPVTVAANGKLNSNYIGGAGFIGQTGQVFDFRLSTVMGGGSGVSSLAGTAGGILVNGGTSPQLGAVTVSLPTAITTVNSLTSVGGQPLILATGTSGTVITADSASGVLTIAHPFALPSGSTAATQTVGTNNTTVATTAFVLANQGTTGAAGSNTQVQYNASGSFGANSAFTSDTSGNVGVHNLVAGGNVEAVTASVTGPITFGSSGSTIQDTGSNYILMSKAGEPLTLSTGSFGNALVIASATGNANFGANIAVSGNIAPNTDNTYTLGLSTSNRWANVFATTFTGALTGNATTATSATTAATLATPRAINGVNFDGSAAITVPAAAGTLTGSTLASGVTASSLTSVGTLGTLAVSGGVTNTGGITGVATNTAAAAGNIGEVLAMPEVADTTTAVSSVTNVAGGSTVGITLTPGDWDVYGVAYLATTSVTGSTVVCGISTATTSYSDLRRTAALPVSLSAVSAHYKFVTPTTQFIVGTNTNIYLCISIPGSSGSATCGGYMYARRSANAK